ncbi:MAG: CheR family methyltransferase [Methanotrichaceae archaeon]
MKQKIKNQKKNDLIKSPISSQSQAPKSGQKEAFYIVGMGGSAGSLESFEQFFKNLPSDARLSFVVVSHLDPDHKDILHELLQRVTAMKVSQAEDGEKVQPNHVYVIPPGKDLSLMHGTLQLLDPTQPRGLRLPIDFFFRHLAEDQGDRSIAIIFSGMGTDGTLGLKAIKEKQGMLMAEDPETASYNAMPVSAINTGLIDYVASANELPERLLEYVNHITKIGGALPLATDEETQTSEPLQKIFAIVRAKTGTDFSLYKKSTTSRRIERRMAVHQISDINKYVRYLQENSSEIDILFKEFLIGVTSFFRDPEAFEALKLEAIPKRLKKKENGESIRVWVIDCSTGEEAYSIAIILRESLDNLNTKSNLKIQIYATDLDKEAIDVARQGIYPENIAGDVSPERLKKFFVQLDDGRYRMKSEIRDIVVFAVQNVLTDPPFTKLDLLSCRNLLIYLKHEAQMKLMALFYYSLNPKGILFLGSSESLGGLTDLFSTVDNKWKIFERKESTLARTDLVEFPASLLPYRTRMHGNVKPPKELEANITEIAQKLILQTIAPPVVLINGDGDILYITRQTGKYLEPPVGKANMNIHAMAREGLEPELAIAIRRAKAEKTKVTAKGLKIKTNESWQTINLIVAPIAPVAPIDQPVGHLKSLDDLLLVQFEDVPAKAKEAARSSKKGPRLSTGFETINRELETELQSTKEQLQSVIEESQSSQEELKSANEELQSTNEEMVSSKEELQSLNEELTTLNAELSSKNDELMKIDSDMRNLLNSTQIPTIFLDNNLKIKRFTPYATKIFNLIPGDIGRPITDISSKLLYKDLVQDTRDVLQTMVSKDAQVRTEDNAWYQIRIIPYQTVDNIIDGGVITFSDITALKNLEEALRKDTEERFIWQALDKWPGAIFIYDLVEKRNIYVSLFASSLLGYPKDTLESADETFWRSLYNPDDALKIVDLANWLATAREGDILQREYRIKRSDGKWRWFVDRSTVLSWTPDHKPRQILEVLEDITELKRAEQQQENLHKMTVWAEYAEGIIRTIREPLMVLDDDLRAVSANPSFYRVFRMTPQETEGHLLYDLGNHHWDIPALRQLLEDILPKSTQIEDFLVEHDFPGIGHRKMLINARWIGQEDSPRQLILLAIEDVTDRKGQS